MAKKQVSAPAAPAPANRPPYMLIEEIRVQGYKSLVDATLHVRPLTLLAGTNSSGKSSIMQPLLLIKQTMEAPYQPAGALVLDGAHVQAETAGELVSKIGNSEAGYIIEIVGANDFEDSPIIKAIELRYEKRGNNFYLAGQQTTDEFGKRVLLSPTLNQHELQELLPKKAKRMMTSFLKDNHAVLSLEVDNGFLAFYMNSQEGGQISVRESAYLESILVQLMHVPGLRDRPKRTYRATFYNHQIKGTFDLYAAGTVSQWQQQEDTEKLEKLNDYLRRLGLTDSVTAKVKNANEVELSVSRLPAGAKGKPRKADMVNIADVGIGVSQVLPILVALIAAQEGQIVYVEQPELHLHPRAQVAMAELLAEAANRGVRVIVETHSSLLLLTVQTLIAQERIKNTDVALHWFARDAKGATQVTYVQPDEDGAYGKWPEDFGDVELKAQDAYLTAVGVRHFGNAVK
ncbi:AAA family ATPase [Hymenobacter terricola]|uniref:AAA family ATPase n=1 Tax=Hymenobacter terricola TaxID=2819236 RepID=UPI001B316A05|nr:AAA family ATPase [Hymenobacter terricola]